MRPKERTPVEDQGPHRTCWAHGATVAIEGAWKIAGNLLMQVSVQQLVDGCNNFGGAAPRGLEHMCGRLQQFQRAQGPYGMRALCSVTTPFIARQYPYVGDVDKSRCSVVDAPHDGACIQHTTCRPNSQCGTGQPCQADEEQLLQMLQDGPMAISVAHEGFAGYAGGVIKGNCACANCDHPYPTHAVALVGFASDDEEGNGPHWILKNSWGTGFGEGGYFRMQFGVNCLALASGGPCQADARMLPPPPTPTPPPPTPTPPSFCSRFRRPGCRRHKKCHWVGMKCVAK